MVPENRQEVTTEGGLDVSGQRDALRTTVKALGDNGTRVSMFIDPDLDQVRASAEIGAAMIELHTGTFANHSGDARKAEVERLVNVNKGHIATDHDGDVVFLTRLQWDIDRIQRDYPDLKLAATKDVMV